MPVSSLGKLKVKESKSIEDDIGKLRLFHQEKENDEKARSYER